MYRSPIFGFIVFLFAFSCQKKGIAPDATTEKGARSSDTLIAHYSEMGATFQAKQQFDSAFYYFSKSKELAEQHKDFDYMAYNLLAMAHIQQTSGDYASSEETLTEALPFLEEHSDYHLAALNLFGIAAKEVKDYDEAIRYYNQLIPLVKDSVRQATLANNIGAIYTEQEKYANAIATLKPFLNAAFSDSIPQQKARIMDNLGYAYFKNGQWNQGLPLLNEALKIRIEVADSYGSIMSYLHLADYFQIENPKEASRNAEQAYALATRHGSPDERLEALAHLMRYNSTVGVNTFAVKYAKLNDSLIVVRNKAKNQFAKIKYDAQKANVAALQYKTEGVELALQLQKRQLQNYLMGFGLFLLLLMLVYLRIYYKNQNTQQRLKASYLTETRIAKMVHDELANDVFYTMNFAETQDLLDSDKKEKLLDHLDQIYHKTRNISKENSPIDTGETFFIHLKEMLNSYKSAAINVIIKNGNPIDWGKISDDKKIALQRVLQELMVNMKKHSKATFVVIGFDGGQNQVNISYADNGIGCVEATILKNGLQNAENRIHAIKGRLTFDFSSPVGFKVQIVIPS